MPEQHLQRWTDVALKREGGNEITKGAARLYGALLVRETEGLLKLVLRLFSSIPPRALHNLTSSSYNLHTHWLFFGLIAMR